MNKEELIEKAYDVRKNVLRMGHVDKRGFIAQSLGAADFLTVLYFHAMKYHADDPKWEGRDRFLLSAGHNAIAVYAAMAEAGFFPKDWLDTYGLDNSRLPMSCMPAYTPGIEISGGSISIDGIDTTSVPRWNVHDQFSMVLQDTWVFRGTVRENIAYSKPGVTDEQIVSACKAVGLDHFVRSLPQGYDTVLDDNTSLSQGQRQLLTIARAMVQDAPILILDEATSSVDTRTEELIQKAMDALTVGRTSFVIAHRLSTIRDADMILVMNYGDVIERGTHEELLAAGGFYADLYNSQFTLTD